MPSDVHTIPKIGVGLGYRRELAAQIETNKDMLDCVEIISEGYISSVERLRRLYLLTQKYNVIPHGVNLSIASPFIDLKHLEGIKNLCDVINAPYYSEHLSLTMCQAVA